MTALQTAHPLQRRPRVNDAGPPLRCARREAAGMTDETAEATLTSSIARSPVLAAAWVHTDLQPDARTSSVAKAHGERGTSMAATGRSCGWPGTACHCGMERPLTHWRSGPTLGFASRG
jgi:hypothetical protein